MGRGMASHTAWRARAHCEGEGCRRTGGRGQGRGVGNRWGREGARKTQASPGTLSTPSEFGKCQVQPRRGHRREALGFSPAVIGRLLSASGNAAGPGAHKRTPMLAPAPSRGAPSYRQLTWPRFPAAAPLLTPSPALPHPHQPGTGPEATSAPARLRVPREPKPSSAPDTPVGSELCPQHQTPSSHWAAPTQGPPPPPQRVELGAET